MFNFKVLQRKIATVLRNPASVPIKILYGISPLIGDKLYLSLLFPLNLGYKLDLDNPITYNEKLQWLKLHYRKPELTKLVDKYEVKEFVKKTVGSEYVVKNYGVWDSFDEINFDNLPNQFVLKTTHDQGGIVICTDKTKLDFMEINRKLTKHLKFKHYYLTREWPYKNIQPRIIAEELLFDNKKDIWDYKFYCFSGEPKVMYISMGRQGNHVPLYFYDMEFNLLNITRPGHKHDNKEIDQPGNWDLMIDIAKKLSIGHPHVRVDFYNVNNKVQVGELTLFQGGGMMPFEPKVWDYKFGDWIDLPKKNS